MHIGEAGEARLVSHGLAEAQRSLRDATDRPEVYDRSKRHTERVVFRFFDTLGWSVQVKWFDDGSSR